MTDENSYSTPNSSFDRGNEEQYQLPVLSFNGRLGRPRYLAYSTGISLLTVIVLGLIFPYAVARDR